VKARNDERCFTIGRDPARILILRAGAKVEAHALLFGIREAFLELRLRTPQSCRATTIKGYTSEGVFNRSDGPVRTLAPTREGRFYVKRSILLEAEPR